MTIMTLFGGLQSRQKKAETLIGTDADTLMKVWGDTAYDVANQLSWREDCGLMHTATPGHWGRVSQEIGRRLGIKDRRTFNRGLLAA